MFAYLPRLIGRAPAVPAALPFEYKGPRRPGAGAGRPGTGAGLERRRLCTYLAWVPLAANVTLCSCHPLDTDVLGVPMSCAEVIRVLGAEQMNVSISARFSEGRGVSRGRSRAA